MSDNVEWLKSLSDKALRDEIKYGRVLAQGGHHEQFHRRELEEAEAEMRRRQGNKGTGNV